MECNYKIDRSVSGTFEFYWSACLRGSFILSHPRFHYKIFTAIYYTKYGDLKISTIKLQLTDYYSRVHWWVHIFSNNPVCECQVLLWKLSAILICIWGNDLFNSFSFVLFLFSRAVFSVGLISLFLAFNYVVIAP